MTNQREQLKLKLDESDDATIKMMYHILLAIEQSKTSVTNNYLKNSLNPLKNTVVFEADIVAPINENWDVDRQNILETSC